MGAMQTADGQTIWVPDDPFAAQPYNPALAPPEAAPQSLPPEILQGLGFGSTQVQQPPMAPAPQPDLPPTQIPASAEITPKQSAAADKVLAAQHAQLDAQAKADRAQQAQQAAYAATPQGEIETATAREEGAGLEQQTINDARGNLEAQRDAEQYAVKLKGEADAAQIAQAGVARQQAAAAVTEQARIRAAKSVEAEANYKIDDNRRWHEMGTGKKVLAGIAVIMSGLGDALQRKSGPNMAFQMIMDAIHQDVAAQVRDKAELGKKAGLAKDSLDRHIAEAGSIPAATDRLLAQRKTEVANQLDLVASKYAGPDKKLAAQEHSAALRVSAAKDLQESAVKSSSIIQQREQLKLDRERVSQGWAGQAQTRAIHDETMAMDQKKLDAQVAETSAKLGVEAAHRERELAIPGVHVTGEDGKEKIFVATAGRPEDVAAVKNVVAGVRKYVSMLDRANEIGVKWASNTANSNELQELKTLQGNMDLNAQQLFKLGVLQENDLKLTHQASGAADLTQWKDSQAGRDEARRLAIKNLDIELHSSLGMPAKDRFDIKEYKAPARTAEEEHIDRLIAAPPQEHVRRYRVDGPAEIKAQPVSAEQKEMIRVQGAIASGGGSPEAIAKAIALLQHVADNAEKAELRALANAKLQDVAADQIPMSPEQVR